MPTVSLNTFPGLDLRDDPQEVTGAIDLLNVEFDQAGRVRARDGFAKYTSSAAAGAYTLLAKYNGAAVGNQLLATRSGNTDAFNSATGAVLATTAGGPFYSWAALGTPSAEYLYMGRISAVPIRWDGSSFTVPTATVDGVAGRAMPKAYCLAVTPWDNRLVGAGTGAAEGPNGVASSASHVWFSGDGTTITAETWGSNNYVQVTPGDGEEIQAAVAWGRKVFVFKETKFFVFDNTSTSATGQPIFDYETVASGIGIPANGSRVDQAVAGPDGVYFIARRGVYRTTGSTPQRISAPLDPLFDAGLTVGPGPVFVGKFLIFGSGTSTQYVLNIETQQWSKWNLPANGLIGWEGQPAGPEKLHFSMNTGGNHVGVKSSASTTDNATAIGSNYRTGAMDFGTPEQEKWFAQMMLSGTGTVNVKTAVNDASALSSAVSVAMGTNPAVATGRWGAGTRGRDISVEVSATSGAWSLSHLSLEIRAIRPAGVRAA